MKGRHRVKQHLKAEIGGRELGLEEARAELARAYAGHRASAIIEGLEARIERPVDAPDWATMRRAMDAVEARIVEALWTLSRLPQGRGPEGPSRHGIDYFQEHHEAFANAVSAGGQWEQETPRPSPPTSREIDAYVEPLEWLTTRRLLPPDRARLVWVAASLKRGDVLRNVAWARVVMAVPALSGCSVRTLQRRYEDGIRAIVAELLVRGEG